MTLPLNVHSKCSRVKWTQTDENVIFGLSLSKKSKSFCNFVPTLLTHVSLYTHNRAKTTNFEENIFNSGKTTQPFALWDGHLHQRTEQPNRFTSLFSLCESAGCVCVWELSLEWKGNTFIYLLFLHQILPFILKVLVTCFWPIHQGTMCKCTCKSMTIGW